MHLGGLRTPDSLGWADGTTAVLEFIYRSGIFEARVYPGGAAPLTERIYAGGAAPWTAAGERDRPSDSLHLGVRRPPGLYLLPFFLIVLY